MPYIVESIENLETRKRFSSDGNNIKQVRTYFPKWLSIVEEITEEDLSLELIEDRLRYWENHNRNVLLLRNAPIDQSIEQFQRLNSVIGDSSSRFFILDIDWKEDAGFEGLPNPERPLLEKWEYVREELSLPNCGAVLKCSSSGYVELGYNKLCLQAFVILDRPLDEQGLRKAFHGLLDGEVGIDPCMTEKARATYIQKPNKTKEVKWLAREETILRVDGEPLDVSLLSQANACKKPYKNRLKTNTNKNKKQLTLDELILDECKGDKKKAKRIFNWWEDIEEITLSMAKKGKLEGRRNAVLYDLMKLSFEVSGNTKKGKEFILNHEEVRGDWTEKDIQAKEDNINEKWCLDRWSGGDVVRAFNPDEVKKVHVLDLKELEEEVIEDLPREGVLLIKSGCGSGKTSAIIKHLTKDVERVIGITHRIAILEGMCPKEKLNLTFYKEAGIDKVHPKFWEMRTEKERKDLYCPDEDRLAITINSLQSVLREGAITKPFDVVVIDEVEQVLDYFRTQAEGIGNKQSTIRQLSLDLMTLLMLCEQARLVVVADDSASHEITGYFVNYLIAQNSEIRKHLLINDRDYVEEMVFYMCDGRYELIWSIIDRLLEGKKVHVFTDRANGLNKTLEKLKRVIQSLTGMKDNEVMWFDSELLEDQLKEGILDKDNVRSNPNKAIPKLMDKGLKCLITSPFIDCGWSYERSEPEYMFDECFLLLEDNFIHHQKMKSLLRRDRFTHTHRIWTRAGYTPDWSREPYTEWNISGRLIDPLEAFQKRLNQGLRKRQENIRRAFESDISSLGGTVCKNNISFELEDKAFIGEVFRQAEIRELDEETIRQIKQDTKLAYQFVDASNHADVKALEGSESLLKQCKRYNSQSVQEILDLWEMDNESLLDLNLSGSEAYQIQKDLLDEIGGVISSAYGQEDNRNRYRAFYDWLNDSDREDLVILLLDTPEIAQFKSFIEKNLSGLRENVLFNLGAEGKQKTPLSIMKIFAEQLFLDCKKVHEAKADSERVKPKPQVKQRLYESYGFKKVSKETEKRYEATRRIKIKLNKGMCLTWQERDYLPFMERIVISKRSYIPKQLMQHIKEIIDEC